MISDDEPAELRHAPEAFVFEHKGFTQIAFVSKTLTKKATVQPLVGEYGRSWLFDPCSMALFHGMHAARLHENARDVEDRRARRRAKDALAGEEAAARRIKTSSW